MESRKIKLSELKRIVDEVVGSQAQANIAEITNRVLKRLTESAYAKPVKPNVMEAGLAAAKYDAARLYANEIIAGKSEDAVFRDKGVTDEEMKKLVRQYVADEKSRAERLAWQNRY